MSFREKYGPWAVVSGASAGLGACFARDLAARGLNLVLVARRADRLEELGRELEAGFGVETLAVPLDLCQDGFAGRLVEAVGGREVGLLINNAGFGATGGFLEADPAWNARMVRLNCEATVLLAHAFLPAMVDRGRGGMVMVGSTASFQPCPWMAVYGATKAFDLMLGEALDEELRGQGVDVLSLCPGHTDTEFHQVAGVKGPVAGGSADPAVVVKGALDRLGRKQHWVPGLLNKLMSLGARFGTRRMGASLTGKMLKSRMVG
ncbi:MAG: SDR family oxidoreductase [Planctomycetes bacterium]|nr:SDR family oxidoreductase [Planctomycetota bacterium]